MSEKIDKNKLAPALLYETIACYAFNSQKKEDPEGIAFSGFFDNNFVPTLTINGLHAMYAIIDQLIKKTNDPSQTTEYYGIRNSLEVGTEQQHSLEWLSYLADLINES